jgi:radical SAM superfamily enzyme YgiQ (UPF0313 family)
LNNILLISTYDLGHQPFGLASPAAWLKAAGFDVYCLDLAVQKLNETLVIQADLIALYLPMHTPARLAIGLLPRLKCLNQEAHLCCYGLYASENEEYLRQLGVHTILGGEFEKRLLALCHRLFSTNNSKGSQAENQPTITISMERQKFREPDRSGLPKLDDYAHLITPGGTTVLAGYTEASRGCKHLCRHCPIVPVYNGQFRIVQKDVVLADVRQQVKAGAQHITFGDPDFFNGPGHSIPIVEAIHNEFPGLTYDVTIKIEHLLKYDRLISVLRNTGCLFITTAVESLDDHVLEKLQKGHTRADFQKIVIRLSEIGLALNPTFIPFTPWVSAQDYMEMLATIKDLNLINSVSPVQYAIRLLIPSGSHLLKLPDIQELVEPFNHAALYYPWTHPDREIDQLYDRIYHLVYRHQKKDETRSMLFEKIWQAGLEIAPDLKKEFPPENTSDFAARPVPRLSESWYC